LTAASRFSRILKWSLESQHQLGQAPALGPNLKNERLSEPGRWGKIHGLEGGGFFWDLPLRLSYPL
jgi:hypothetical protein